MFAQIKFFLIDFSFLVLLHSFFDRPVFTLVFIEAKPQQPMIVQDQVIAELA